MKILIVRTYPSIMNIYNYNSQEIGLAKAFTEKGHQCDIVYYNGKNPDYEKTISCDSGDIKIFMLKGFSFFKNGFFYSLSNLLPEYDIIQVSEYDQLLSWWLYTYSRHRHKTVVYHGSYHCTFNKGYNFKCKVFDMFFLNRKRSKSVKAFVKSTLAETFLREKGFQSVTTVGVGLDTDRFKEAQSDDWINHLIAQKQDRKYLLYVGVLEQRRNIPFLIDLLAEVRKTHKNIYLVIIGKGELEYIQNCTNYATEKNMLDYIIYTKSLPQTQLTYLYQECEVFLLPTIYEIFGMVLLEAMYFGVPVISTVNGGSDTMIENKVNGFTLDIEEKKQWVQTICTLLDSPDAKQAIGNKAAETIRNNYLWNQIADKFLTEYHTILSDLQ